MNLKKKLSLTLIALARLAYFRVDKVSSKLQAAGDIAASMVVSELPPSDSCRTRVSLLFLYGMNVFLPFPTSTKALITFPKAERDLLIFAPSLSVAPVAPIE
jgi:hypothetical protein